MLDVCVPFQVDQSLLALQTEVENFILRMAAEFPLRKEQLLFLINNYDMMLSVLSVSTHKHTNKQTHALVQNSVRWCMNCPVAGVRFFLSPHALSLGADLGRV